MVCNWNHSWWIKYSALRPPQGPQASWWSTERRGGSGRCQISYFDAELGQYGLPQQGLALKKKIKKKVPNQHLYRGYDAVSRMRSVLFRPRTEERHHTGDGVREAAEARRRMWSAPARINKIWTRLSAQHHGEVNDARSRRRRRRRRWCQPWFEESAFVFFSPRKRIFRHHRGGGGAAPGLWGAGSRLDSRWRVGGSRAVWRSVVHDYALSFGGSFRHAYAAVNALYRIK